MIASGAFHNEDVDFLLGKHGRLHDCLIIEVDIAGVENRLVPAAQKNSGGAEDMAGVVKFESYRPGFVRSRAFAGNCDPLSDGAGLPQIARAVGFTMREERVKHDAEFFALSGHDVNGVMQKSVAN